MTTRKELIERIQSMQLGTQEMLDAAADDATLIPFDTLFLAPCGQTVTRLWSVFDGKDTVYFAGLGHVEFYAASQLRPMSED